METNIGMIRDMLREKQSRLESKREQLGNEYELVKVMSTLLESVTDLERRLEDSEQEKAEALTAMEKKEALIEKLTQERNSLKDENTSLKMMKKELCNMSSKVVQKTEHEDLLKFFRSYINLSRRKSVKKRGYIKMVIQEMSSSTHINLPDEIEQELEHLDDDNLTLDIHTDKVEVGEAQIERNEAAITIKEQYNYDGIYQPQLRGNQDRQAIECVC